MRLDIVYFERFIYRPWILALSMALGVLGLLLLLPFMQGVESALLGLAALLCIIAGVVIFNSFSASLWVYPDGLRIAFGRGFPYASRSIAFDTVTSVEVLPTPPELATTGWSLHRIDTHEGPMSVAATSSKGAVLLRASGPPLVVATAYPERLHAAIVQHLVGTTDSKLK